VTPRWLLEAATHVGKREVPGPGFNPWIKSMWLSLRGGSWYWNAYKSDDTQLPWCGAFVAYCLMKVGEAIPNNYASARAWLQWGVECGIDMGAVCVLERGAKFGHVGFVVAISHDNQWVCLRGGNQDDGVTDAWFKASRVLGYRRPASEWLTAAVRMERGAESQRQA
jgi:uncharacterized protein (TIGR02594 family)